MNLVTILPVCLVCGTSVMVKSQNGVTCGDERCNSRLAVTVKKLQEEIEEKVCFTDELQGAISILEEVIREKEARLKEVLEDVRTVLLLMDEISMRKASMERLVRNIESASKYL